MARASVRHEAALEWKPGGVARDAEREARAMSARGVVRALLPPIVLDGLKKLRDAQGQAEYEAVSGWSAMPGTVRGWNVETVARAERQGWPRFLAGIAGAKPLAISHEALASPREEIASQNTHLVFGYALARAARHLDRASLLDWGGGIGHYYALAKALLPEVEIEYHGRDLPAMCREGRALFPEAKFHEDDDACFARSYDLVLASSSLQYREDWRALAARLAAATRGFLLVTRLPIVLRGGSRVVLQRAERYGYGTEYLGWALDRKEFVEAMEGQSMRLEREFLIQEIPPIRGMRERVEQRGYLFRPARSGS